MWVWRQKEGTMRQAAGALLASGYSGIAMGKNEPSAQHLEGIGPIPIGAYHIGFPFDHPERGPLCLPLTPHPDNQMFSRSGFLIHGDNKDPAKAGTASHGCIILPRFAREILAGPDHLLVVLP